MILFLLLASLLPSPVQAKFILPKSQIILASPKGVTFFTQAWIERHEENRRIQFHWDGPSCYGDAQWDIDPDSPRIQPTYAPLKISAGYGRCELEVRVLTGSGKVRASAQMTVKVCGELTEDGC